MNTRENSEIRCLTTDEINHVSGGDIPGFQPAIDAVVAVAIFLVSLGI